MLTRKKYSKKELIDLKELSINSGIKASTLASRIEPYYGISGHRIHGDNRKLFQSLYGKCDYAYDSWYRSFNWFVEFQNTVFIISCSRRGADYYLVLNDSNFNYVNVPQKYVDISYEFILEISKLIKENKIDEID